MDNAISNTISRSNEINTNMVKKLSKYKNIINELIQTEKSLITDMELIFMQYTPMIDEIDCEETKICINNLEDIISVGKTLIDKIDDIKHCPLDVCELFNELIPSIKSCYSQYCTTYPSCALELARLRTNPKYNKILNDIQHNLNHLLPLESYLLKPVQRIMKYPILLHSISKLNMVDSKSQIVLDKTHKNLAKISEYINEGKRETEGISLVTHFSGIITNLKEPLTLEKVGPVQLHNEFHKGSKRFVAILFSKILLLTRPQSDGKLSLFRAFPISDIILLENTSKSSTSFQISSYTKRKKATTFEARKKELKDQWITHIKALILENMSVNFNDTKLSAMLGEKVGSHVSTILSVKEDVANATWGNTLKKNNVFSEKNDDIEGNTKRDFPDNKNHIENVQSIIPCSNDAAVEKNKIYSIDKILDSQNEINDSICTTENDIKRKATTAIDVFYTISDYKLETEQDENTKRIYESIPWSKKLIAEAIIETDNIIENEQDDTGSEHLPITPTHSRSLLDDRSNKSSGTKSSNSLNNGPFIMTNKTPSTKYSRVSDSVCNDNVNYAEQRRNKALCIIQKYESIDERPNSTSEFKLPVSESLASRVQKLFENKNSDELHTTKHRRVNPTKAGLISKRLMELQEKAMVDIKFSGYIPSSHKNDK